MYGAVERLAFRIREDLKEPTGLIGVGAKLGGMCKLNKRTLELPSPELQKIVQELFLGI